MIQEKIEESDLLEENTSLIEYKEKKWYQKVFDKVLGLFKGSK